MADTVRLDIHESSQVGEARRRAVQIAGRLGFDEPRAGNIAIAVSELATNLLKHGRGGELLLRSDGHGDLELIAIDRGPGMGSFETSARDGHSTSGSSGIGLGAVSRLCQDMEVYSRPGAGTVLAARFRVPGPEPLPHMALDFAGLAVAKEGEIECGDGFAALPASGSASFVLVDGLGHGSGAAQAASDALRAARARPDSSPEQVLALMHQAIDGKRGAAAAVARIEPEKGRVLDAGIGNIGATLVSMEKRKPMVSHHGTLGMGRPRFQTFEYPWSLEQVLVMHSDGLSTRWSLDAYPGILARRPSVIAAVLLRDFNRLSDDVTVLVVKGRPS